MEREDFHPRRRHVRYALESGLNWTSRGDIRLGDLEQFAARRAVIVDACRRW